MQEHERSDHWLALRAVAFLCLLTFSVQAVAQSAVPIPTEQIQPDSSRIATGRLELTCVGGGSANKVDVISSGETSNFSGSAVGRDGVTTFSGSGSSSEDTLVPRAQSFVDQMDLFVENGGGRIRVPRVMLPLLRGGENGWFKLKDVKLDADAITASVAINFMNNPKLRIDRRTGVVNLSGKAGDFTGRCQKALTRTQERQF